MIKREKKLSVTTLNRLNEEDESLLVGSQDPDGLNKAESSYKPNQQNESDLNELAIEKKKLTQSIDGVFKAVPLCDGPNILDDQKRLESLEQVLINRLILNFDAEESNIIDSNNQFGIIINN